MLNRISYWLDFDTREQVIEHCQTNIAFVGAVIDSHAPSDKIPCVWRLQCLLNDTIAVQNRTRKRMLKGD